MTHNIRHQIAAIKQKEIHRVFENLKRRINLCIGELGGHFQQLLRVSNKFFINYQLIVPTENNKLVILNL